jgi:putative transposase
MKRLKRDTTDWHVTLRGPRRLALFRCDEDYQTFYGLLSDALRRTGASLHAQCLLGNHAHLSPRASSAQLSELMHRTDLPYAKYHNTKYGLSGHSFDRTYFAKEIRSPRILAFVSRYIHLNPVRAHPSLRPEQHPWSSAGQLLGDAEGPIRVTPLPTLAAFSPDLETARRLYGDFVARGLQKAKPMPPGGWSAMDVWQQEFEWILDTTSALAAAWAPLTATDVASWLGVQVGVPARAIGRALGHPDGRSVSRRVYAVGKRIDQDPALQRVVREMGIL